MSISKHLTQNMIITETKNNRFPNPFKVRKLKVFDFASSFVVSITGVFSAVA